MRLRNKRRTVAYVVGIVVAIAALGWAESQIWYSVNYLRHRAESISSEGYHYSDHLEAKVREINEHLFRYIAQPSATLQEMITTEGAALDQWLTERRGMFATGAQRDAFVRFEAKSEIWLQHLSRVFVNGNARSADWQEQYEKILDDLIGVLRELAVAERAALAGDLEATRSSMTMLYRKLTIASVILLGVGASLALMIYQGFIAPLRHRLEQTREAMQQQEKLTSLGVLAAGVAHEIRNPLTSIKARLFTQKALLPEHTEPWEDNLFITEEISRLERIVRDFLAFARPSEPRMVTMKAGDPFRDLDPLIRVSMEKARITLVREFTSDDLVQADPQQIKQVLLNLVQNAAESIGNDGQITLRTRTEQRRLRKKHAVVMLEVEDTGPGLSPEAQKRLFDPFFTTKPSGTGLGLSIAARILENHSGKLEYESGRAGGALFRVVLPIALHDESDKNSAR